MPVEILRRRAAKGYSARRLKKVAAAVLDIVGATEAELSLAFIGDREMRRLNARYRGRDYATDVLSFPADENLPPGTRLLGDVVISVDKAASQAREKGRGLDQELVTLVIHGIVHLLGYDHERSAKEAKRMKRLENKIYRRLCDRGLIQV
ncbi:MAG TPA: rRNA maturation RNase YbeY [Candidatus Binatia bacterium]|nr:rRNA maturation RNase YbeY [Candidatus Binatia bacterium]